MKQKEEIRVLKGELAITKQDYRLQFKRPVPLEPEERQALNEAVIREVKKRRKLNEVDSGVVTLRERRAHDTSVIKRTLKDHGKLLTPWSTIITNALSGITPQRFVWYSTPESFIDGFNLAVTNGIDKH